MVKKNSRIDVCLWICMYLKYSSSSKLIKWQGVHVSKQRKLEHSLWNVCSSYGMQSNNYTTETTCSWGHPSQQWLIAFHSFLSCAYFTQISFHDQSSITINDNAELVFIIVSDVMNVKDAATPHTKTATTKYDLRINRRIPKSNTTIFIH